MSFKVGNICYLPEEDQEKNNKFKLIAKWEYAGLPVWKVEYLITKEINDYYEKAIKSVRIPKPHLPKWMI